MTERRRPSLALRLAAAFVAVAVVAVATLAVVVLLTTRSETRRLSDRDRQAVAERVAGTLAGAYEAAGSWAAANVTPAADAAARDDAVLVVRDARGQVVVSPGRGRGAGRQGRHRAVVTSAITVAGDRVGTAELRFPETLGAAEQELRDELAGAALLGSAIAIAIALLAAALVGRRLAAPVRRLTDAARRVRSGDRTARAGTGAPGELGELADAFDGMAAALEDEDRARRQLVSDLSHEVRTPITVLRGNLEELIDGIAEPTPARLGSLHEEVLRLEALVEHLDALRRAGVPVRDLARAPVDLAAVVAAGLEALGPQLAAKGLTVDRRLDEAVVDGDRAALGQIVANLLSNALKFAPEGGRIDVGVSRAGDAVLLQVADDGPGIAPHERAHVFDRFWRGAAGAGVAGLGIGLAVVADVVAAHGGTVAAGERPGGGALLEVRLPAAAARGS